MSEGITQYEIDCQARDHLNLIVPLLNRLGGLDADQCSVGYVEKDGRGRFHFTDQGWSTVEAGRKLAWDSAMYLSEEVLAEATGHHETRLAGDVQDFLAATAAALAGMTVDDSPRVNGPRVACSLSAMAWSLQRRAKEEDEAREAKERKAEAGKANLPSAGKLPELVGHGDVRDIVHQVRVHGLHLRAIAKEALSNDARDAELDTGILKELRECTANSAHLLWHIESDLAGQEQPKGWQDFLAGDTDALNVLPTCVLALDHILEEPRPSVMGEDFADWRFPAMIALRAAWEMIAWAVKHAPEEDADA